MPINLVFRGVKGTPLDAFDHDNNLLELSTKLAPKDSPNFTGPVIVPTPSANPDYGIAAPCGWVREIFTGLQTTGSITYALLAATNTFTQPQIVPSATLDTHAINRGQMRADTLRAGDIKLSARWYGGGMPGWVQCDGQSLASDTNADTALRAFYADLFAAVGYVYGGSSGTGLFKVPDLRGRVPVHYGTGTGLTARYQGQIFGEENHLIGYNEMPNHSHQYSVPLSVFGSGNYWAWGAGGAFTGYTEQLRGGYGVTGQGAVTAMNVCQPSIALNYWIKL